MTRWAAILYGLALVVAVVGEPRPVALFAALFAAATATFDIARGIGEHPRSRRG